MATMDAMLPFGADPVPPYISLPVAAILLGGMSLVGYRVIPARLRPRRAHLTIPLTASVGMTTVGVVVWTVGAVVGTTAAMATALAMMAAGLTAAKPWWMDGRRFVRRVAALLRHQPALAVLGLATAALAVPQLLLPVVDSDGLRYHLALAKLYLLEGRVVFYPWDVHAAFPQAVEAVQMLGLGAAGGEVAKFLHFGAFVGSLAVLTLLVHHDRGSRRAAVCAPWFFAASPAVMAAAGAAFIDLFVVLHVGVAALLARFRVRPLVIGFVIAGAMTAKWSAAPAVLGIALLVWARTRFRPGTAVALALPAIVALSPFMVRNLIATGDPAYPMGVGLVKGEVPGVNEERHEYVTQVHREIPGPFGIPWGASVGEVQPDEVAGWHLLLGLVALPLAIRRPHSRELLAVAVPYLLVGLVYHPSVRLAMPLLWALAALAAGLTARVAGRWTPAVGTVLVLPALVVAWTTVGAHGRPLELLRGRLTAAEVLRLTVPGREAALLVNHQPPGGRVMALDFPAPFYFDRPWIVEGILNRPPLTRWLEAGDDAGDVMSRLDELDVRYLVITPGYGGGTPLSLVAVGETPRQAAVMAEVRSRLERVGTRDGVDVYRVPES